MIILYKGKTEWDLVKGNIYSVLRKRGDCYMVQDENGDENAVDLKDCVLIDDEEDYTKDTVVESVVKQYKTRSEVGIKKYGVTLDRNDLKPLDWLQHLQEELMDATLYVEKLKNELIKM